MCDVFYTRYLERGVLGCKTQLKSRLWQRAVLKRGCDVTNCDLLAVALLVLCGASLVLCGASLVLCGASFVLCGASLVLCGASFVLCGAPLVLCGASLLTALGALPAPRMTFATPLAAAYGQEDVPRQPTRMVCFKGGGYICYTTEVKIRMKMMGQRALHTA